MTKRRASISRETSETSIAIDLVLDGSGVSSIKTGIPFFDHMLTLLSKHSLFDLRIEARGDLEVDHHHTVEDTGIVLGKCLNEALGEKAGIKRYGWALLPMDDALAQVAVDLSGRAVLEYRVPSSILWTANFDFQLVEEFLRALATNAGLNLHIELRYGHNGHHIVEAIFKGLAKALDQACQFDPRVTGIPSSKGSL
jgi:imidazoleglycerol-phosphate dehydratase